MNPETWAIPMASLIVVVGAILFTVVTVRSKADTNYVNSIEARVRTQADELVRINIELTDCLRRCQDAQLENIRLTKIALERFVNEP